MSKHYHVVVNTPGYLPESDEPTILESREDAIMVLEDEIARTREGYEGALGDEDVDVQQDGDAKDGYVYLVDAKNEHDLGVVHEIVECDDPSCCGPEDEEPTEPENEL